MNKGAKSERDFAAWDEEPFDAAEDDLGHYVQRNPFHFLKPSWLAIGAAGAVLGLGARWAVMNDWVANDSLVGAGALAEAPRSVKVQPLLPVQPVRPVQPVPVQPVLPVEAVQASRAPSHVRSELPAVAVAETGIAPAQPPVERVLPAASLLPTQNVVVVPPVFMGAMAPVTVQRRAVASRLQGKASALSLGASTESTSGRGLMLPPVSESIRVARSEPSFERGLLVPPSVQEGSVSVGSQRDVERPLTGSGLPELIKGSPAGPGVSQK